MKKEEFVELNLLDVVDKGKRICIFLLGQVKTLNGGCNYLEFSWSWVQNIYVLFMKERLENVSVRIWSNLNQTGRIHDLRTWGIMETI